MILIQVHGSLFWYDLEQIPRGSALDDPGYLHRVLAYWKNEYIGQTVRIVYPKNGR